MDGAWACRNLPDLLGFSGQFARLLQISSGRRELLRPPPHVSGMTKPKRAALDYASELTQEKQVSPATFAQLACHFSERQICEIVWLVASQHYYNMTNIELNIHSDMLCDVSKKWKAEHRSGNCPVIVAA